MENRLLDRVGEREGGTNRVAMPYIHYHGGSLVAERLKCLPATQETRVRSLGWEDPLEKEMAIHASTIAWKIPWTEKPGRLQSRGCKESETTEQLAQVQEGTEKPSHVEGQEGRQ